MHIVKELPLISASEFLFTPSKVCWHHCAHYATSYQPLHLLIALPSADNMATSKQTTRLLVAFLFPAFFGITFAGCPDGYGCYRDPQDCEADKCIMLVTWKANNADGVDFSISARHNSTTPRWAAVGFSSDKKMVSADHLFQIFCVSNIFCFKYICFKYFVGR